MVVILWKTQGPAYYIFQFNIALKEKSIQGSVYYYQEILWSRENRIFSLSNVGNWFISLCHGSNNTGCHNRFDKKLNEMFYLSLIGFQFGTNWKQDVIKCDSEFDECQQEGKSDKGKEIERTHVDKGQIEAMKARDGWPVIIR